MDTKRQFVWLALTVAIAMILVATSGCGPSPTPSPTSTPTPSPTPTLTPTQIPPTATLIPPALALERQPPVEEIQVDDKAAIVAKVEPPQEVNLKWSVTGTSTGKVYPEEGEATIYTAGSQPGIDVVTAEGTTASGAWVTQSISFRVVLPTPTPTLTPSLTPTLAPTPVVVTAPPLPLVHLDPAYNIENSCPIDGSTGSLEYQVGIAGALRGTIILSGMAPERDYILTLNGWPSRDGNDILMKRCEATPDGQGYCDFMTVTTDSQGSVSRQVDVALPAGSYEVKFLVKDPADPNYCVVLFNNDLRFTVE